VKNLIILLPLMFGFNAHAGEVSVVEPLYKLIDMATGEPVPGVTDSTSISRAIAKASAIKAGGTFRLVHNDIIVTVKAEPDPTQVVDNTIPVDGSKSCISNAIAVCDDAFSGMKVDTTMLDTMGGTPHTCTFVTVHNGKNLNVYDGTKVDSNGNEYCPAN
jgi:hypothetical protein